MQKMTRVLVAIAVVATAAATLYPLLPTSPAEPATAAVAPEFDPAYIISDDQFYNGTDVTEADAQNFLNWISPGCASGYTCLKDYRQDTWTRPADAMCRQYSGAASEPAARIITKVAAACGISARVLIVTLQKEQGLVTSTAPTAGKYNIAMGYACPDTAPCDAQFFGFFNQVYKGAWQLKRYGNPPGTSNYFTWYPVGSPSAVRYHPNAACGAPGITIRNKATAALYYYTPYQPNAAAMANLYGTGDACSSYGNRNFWRFYSDWFGSPTGEHSPFGYLDSTATADGGIRVVGWATDPDLLSPMQVQVSIDGVVAETFHAAIVRPDVAAVHPAYGAHHGYDRVIPASPGAHQVCVTAVNWGEGASKVLGCLAGTAGTGTAAAQPNLPIGAPRGWFDSAVMAPGGARVTGWALDPEIKDPIATDFYVDGVRTLRVTAALPNSGVAAMYPAYGAAHAFDEVIPMTAGRHTVCAYGIGYGFGGNALIGCLPVTGGTGSPVGWTDSVVPALRSINVSGWALDPDTASASSVSATLDGVAAGTFVANGQKALAAVYPAYGNSHGFSFSIPSTGGRHVVCVTALNIGAGSPSSLGCHTVDVLAGPPVGWFDSVTPGVGSATVTGWVLDRDTADPISVRATVDGVAAPVFTADQPRTDLAPFYPGYGTNHGFTATIAAAPGPRTICLTGVNVGLGTDTSLGCIRTTVLSGSPFGWFDFASAGAGQITVEGWAIDPSAATSPVEIRASIDGAAATTFTASGTRAELPSFYPGVGVQHGFTVALPASVGRHTVCLTAVNVGAGSDTALGCIASEVRTGSPFGWFDSALRGPAGVTVKGWAIDPDLAGPVAIDVTVGGVVIASSTAAATRTDVAKIYQGHGSAHGFEFALPSAVTGGTVCVTAQNTGPGVSTSLGCLVVR